VTLRRSVGALAFAVALLPVLVACSSGGGGGADAGGSSPTSASSALEHPADEGIKGVMAIRVTSAGHTLGTVDYPIHPPAGGDHNPNAAPCGFYTQQLLDQYHITDESFVHTLEHGGVWLAFSPTLPKADVAKLHTFVDRNDDVFASPYKGLASGVAVVVTAWARQLTLRSVDDPRLKDFYLKYRNGPQAPEAYLTCPRFTTP
jgi:hypothetical protein